MKEITNVSYMRRKKVRKQNEISIHVATRSLWDLRKIESDLSLVWLLMALLPPPSSLLPPYPFSPPSLSYPFPSLPTLPFSPLTPPLPHPSLSSPLPSPSLPTSPLPLPYPLGSVCCMHG